MQRMAHARLHTRTHEDMKGIDAGAAEGKNTGKHAAQSDSLHSQCFVGLIHFIYAMCEQTNKRTNYVCTMYLFPLIFLLVRFFSL